MRCRVCAQEANCTENSDGVPIELTHVCDSDFCEDMTTTTYRGVGVNTRWDTDNWLSELEEIEGWLSFGSEDISGAIGQEWQNYNFSFALDVNNYPRLVDGDNNVDSDYWDGDSWEPVNWGAMPNPLPGYGIHRFIYSAYDRAGTPYYLVGFDNPGGNMMRVGLVYWDGDSWERYGGITNITANADPNRGIVAGRIMFDDNNWPHLAWVEDSSTVTMHVRYVYWDGDSWESQGGDQRIFNANNSLSTFYEEYKTFDFYLDESGFPHIAWTDGNGITKIMQNIRYRYWDGGNWINEDGLSDVNRHASGDIKFDNEGRPFVIFKDVTLATDKSWKIMFYNPDLTDWENFYDGTYQFSTSIAGPGFFARLHNLLFDKYNNPYILWSENGTPDSSHATLNFLSWNQGYQDWDKTQVKNDIPIIDGQYMPQHTWAAFDSSEDLHLSWTENSGPLWFKRYYKYLHRTSTYLNNGNVKSSPINGGIPVNEVSLDAYYTKDADSNMTFRVTNDGWINTNEAITPGGAAVNFGSFGDDVRWRADFTAGSSDTISSRLFKVMVDYQPRPVLTATSLDFGGTEMFPGDPAVAGDPGSQRFDSLTDLDCYYDDPGNTDLADFEWCDQALTGCDEESDWEQLIPRYPDQDGNDDEHIHYTWSTSGMPNNEVKLRCRMLNGLDWTDYSHEVSVTFDHSDDYTYGTPLWQTIAFTEEFVDQGAMDDTWTTANWDGHTDFSLNTACVERHRCLAELTHPLKTVGTKYCIANPSTPCTSDDDCPGADTCSLVPEIDSFVEHLKLGTTDSKAAQTIDFNNDGYLDLVVGGSDTTQITVYENSGPDGFTYTGIGLAMLNTNAIAVGDFDHDNDLDFVVAGDIVNLLYVNGGRPGYALGTVGGFLNGAGAFIIANDVAFVDLNNDGWQDLVFGTPYNEPDYVFLNNSGSFNTITPDYTFGGSGKEIDVYGMEWQDLDNDGDLDMAVATEGYKTQIVWNDGCMPDDIDNCPTEELYTLCGSGDCNTYDLKAGDYDNNGLLDLVEGHVLSANQVQAILHENQGGGSFQELPDFANGDLKAFNTSSNDNFSWVDFNEDGLIDLVGSSKGEGGHIAVNRLDEMVIGDSPLAGGDDPANLYFTEIVTGTDASPIAVGDHDLDGDQDIFIVTDAAAGSAQNYLYENVFTDDPADPDDTRLQSTEVISNPLNITSAALFVVDEIPDFTSINYYVSSDSGSNWTEVFPNRPADEPGLVDITYTTVPTGHNLVWKAELSSTDIIGGEYHKTRVTPKIYKVMIAYSILSEANIRGWGWLGADTPGHEGNTQGWLSVNCENTFYDPDNLLCHCGSDGFCETTGGIGDPVNYVDYGVKAYFQTPPQDSPVCGLMWIGDQDYLQQASGGGSCAGTCAAFPTVACTRDDQCGQCDLTTTQHCVIDDECPSGETCDKSTADCVGENQGECYATGWLSLDAIGTCLGGPTPGAECNPADSNACLPGGICDPEVPYAGFTTYENTDLAGNPHSCYARALPISEDEPNFSIDGWGRILSLRQAGLDESQSDWGWVRFRSANVCADDGSVCTSDAQCPQAAGDATECDESLGKCYVDGETCYSDNDCTVYGGTMCASWCGTTESNCVTLDAEEPDMAYFDGYAWSGGGTRPTGGFDNTLGLGWIDFSPGLRGPYYFRTYWGDIYLQKGGQGESTEYNATYLIHYSDVMPNFYSEFDWLTEYPQISFPEKSGQVYVNALGLLDYEGIINDGLAGTGRYGEVITIDDFSDINFNEPLGHKIYYYDGATGPLVLDQAIEIQNGGDEDAGEEARAAALIVVNEDLILDSGAEISYSETPPGGDLGLRKIASLGWIVRGDLIIDGAVNKMDGAFMVLGDPNYDPTALPCDAAYAGLPGCGRVYSCKTGSCAQTQLKTNGLIMARDFEFDREPIISGPAEVIFYDGRLLANTPPGLESFSQGLPVWTDVAP
ncbi:MAG: FG-GAP-like repeat-containing protein [Patescibacteria group bacterium]